MSKDIFFSFVHKEFAAQRGYVNNPFIAYKWSKSCVPATAVGTLYVLYSRAALETPQSSVTLPEPSVPCAPLCVSMVLVCVTSAGNSELTCGWGWGILHISI